MLAEQAIKVSIGMRQVPRLDKKPVGRGSEFTYNQNIGPSQRQSLETPERHSERLSKPRIMVGEGGDDGADEFVE